MDDYTWKKRLQKRNRRRKMEWLTLILLLAVPIGFFFWRYVYYVSTPEHAIEQVTEAIQNHDVETFEKYVNLDLAVSRGYEDLTWDMFAYDNNLNDKTKVMFETFYKKIKPQVVAGTIDILKNYVANTNGELTYPAENDILKGRQLGIDYQYLIERSQLASTHFVKLGDVVRNGRSADASVDVVDSCTNTHYTLHLILEQDESDNWKIVYVSNYRDYLNLLEPLQNSDITSYVKATQNIVDSYNNTLDGYQTKFRRLCSTKNGEMSSSQRKDVASFVKNSVITALKARQAELDKVECPQGAKHLQALRQQSTDLSIQYWEHFINGIENNSPDEISISKAIQKDATDMDNRINDILKHTAVTQATPSAT